MKNMFLLLTVAVLALSSCSSFMPKATQTPTITNTPIPTSTVTPIPTATVTPTATVEPIPEFMNEFISLGYDKQPISGNSIYVVVDETSARYSFDEWGTKFNQSILYGWIKVYYMKDGLLQTNFALLHFCVPHPNLKQNYFCYFTPSDNINSASNEPPFSNKWTKAQFDFFRKHSVGDYPIARIEFNSEHFDPRNDFSNYPGFSFWGSIYPNYKGTFAQFELPNIGTFLSATYIGYDFSEGKWNTNP